MSDNLNFSATIEMTKEKLIIIYKVENKSTQEIYLTNHAIKQTKNGQIPDMSVAFVYLIEEEKTVHITKRRPPVPQKLLQPHLHFITPLKPQEMYSEKIEILLPVVVNDPYESKPFDANKKVQINFNRVFFSVGYIKGSDKIEVSKSKFQGVDVFSIVPSLNEKGQPAEDIVITEEFLNSKFYPMVVPVILWK